MASVSIAARDSLRATFCSSLRRGAEIGRGAQGPAAGDAHEIDAARRGKARRARRGATATSAPSGRRSRDARPRRAARPRRTAALRRSRRLIGDAGIDVVGCSWRLFAAGCADRSDRRRCPGAAAACRSAPARGWRRRSRRWPSAAPAPPPQTGGRKLIRLRQSGTRPSMRAEALQRVVHRIELGRRDVEHRRLPCAGARRHRP